MNFIELTASIDDIDTTDNLNMFEGYQKIFIVNGANLKVVDFINVKLITDDVGDHAPDFGTLLQGGISGATMSVDYISGVTGGISIYGSRLTDETFEVGETVTGVDDDGNVISFVLSDNEIPGPHWYDWTPWPDGDSGQLPAKAYLGCLYRGRCVISGNPEFPYQWYMSRQANPWDWAYLALDAQAPVAGGNAEAGILGEMVTALIPYQDEYLIFGCVNSLWVMRGDPASGGTLSELDSSIGVFGAQSWCFDGSGNLYFASKDSICVVPAGMGSVQNLTAVLLPNLGKEESLNPAIHRITMEYDRERLGILSCITDMRDGSNSNYWYDLRTQGFFPEEYNINSGVFSMIFYQANDQEERKLIMGGTDGFLRTFNEENEDDDGTSGTNTIDSSVVLPVLLPEDDERDMRLSSLTVTAAGGGQNGGFSDTNSVDIEFYVGDDAEEAIEHVLDEDDPRSTRTLQGPGKSYRIRTRIRNHAVAIRLVNDTGGETWAVNKIAADVREV